MYNLFIGDCGDYRLWSYLSRKQVAPKKACGFKSHHPRTESTRMPVFRSGLLNRRAKLKAVRSVGSTPTLSA